MTGAEKRRAYKRRYVAAQRREIHHLPPEVLARVRREAQAAGEAEAARHLRLYASALLHRAQRQPAPAPYVSWMP